MSPPDDLLLEMGKWVQHHRGQRTAWNIFHFTDNADVLMFVLRWS
jgi:hypothetical protein